MVYNILQRLCQEKVWNTIQIDKMTGLADSSDRVRACRFQILPYAFSTNLHGNTLTIIWKRLQKLAKVRKMLRRMAYNIFKSIGEQLTTPF